MQGTTTAALKSQFGGPSTSKNCALLATDGEIRWHSILQGCRKSEHRRFSHSCSLQQGRRQHFNRIASGEWCRATPLRRHYFNDIGDFIHDYFNSLFCRFLSVSSMKEKEANELKRNHANRKFIGIVGILSSRVSSTRSGS